MLVAAAHPSAPELPPRVAVQTVAFAREGSAPDPAAREEAFGAALDFAPDVVNFHSVFDAGLVDALRERWPSVWTCHDHRAHCPNGDRVYPRSRRICVLPMGRACVVNSVIQGCVRGPRPSTLRALRLRERLFEALGSCDRIAAPSRCVADILSRNGIGDQRVVLAPLFTPLADLADPPALPNRPRVLFAARLVPQKGVADALYVARKLRAAAPQAEFAIAGDGPERDAVARATTEWPALRYLGRLNEAQMRDAYAASTAVVAAPKWLDPYPLVGVEAMALSRPLVAYGRGGIAELLEKSGGGIATLPDDRDGLAQAALRVLGDSSLATELGAMGRSYVRGHHRPKHGLAAAESAYTEALASRGAKPTQPNASMELFTAPEAISLWPLALEVRLAVFVEEQDVPLEAELDDHDTADPTCVHALSRAAPERPIATGRIYDETPGIARIGRMAVLPAFRRSGAGMRILDALLGEARRRGSRQVLLDSQTHAVAFYARRGFRPEGAVFDDCGIPHRRMRVELEL